MMLNMVVTVDGPAAAGKSTAARGLAERLGFEYLDTGAMYRAVTLAALRRGVSFDQEPALEELVGSLRIAVRGRSVLLDGEDVTEAIRDVEVTRASHRLADSPAVRRRMVELQREAARDRNIVTEGRDQGTIVFPDAQCKFFLTARPEVRAQRRHRELTERGQAVALDRVLADQTDRDRRDADRAIAPMVPAPDAVVLDTSNMSLNEVIDALEQHVRRRVVGG
jgi:cytidylate kinase